jgi:hypothetical protein
MAGTLLKSQLDRKSRVQFLVANEEHDASIRRLLTENPISGELSLSFEHEPDYFKTKEIFDQDQTIVAVENDRLLCIGKCSVRKRYFNGQVRKVGYLSELRLDSTVLGRFDILRRGYQFFMELHRKNPLDFYFTSISDDNQRSLRFLERGIKGMPKYKFLTKLVTFLIPIPNKQRSRASLKRKLEKRLTGCHLSWARGSLDSLPSIFAFLNTHSKQHQLTSLWTENEILELSKLGLLLENFQVLFDGSEIVSCVALWDQRSFKQTVIRQYGRKTSFKKPLLNLAASVMGVHGLPPIHSTLNHVALSPLVLAQRKPELLLATLEAAALSASEQDIQFIGLSLPWDDPMLTDIRNCFYCIEYKTRLYGVSWNDVNTEDSLFNNQNFYPEIAFL